MPPLFISACVALLGAAVAIGSLLPEARIVRGLRLGSRIAGAAGIALIALTQSSWLLVPYVSGFAFGVIALYVSGMGRKTPSSSPDEH